MSIQFYTQLRYRMWPKDLLWERNMKDIALEAGKKNIKSVKKGQ